MDLPAPDFGLGTRYISLFSGIGGLEHPSVSPTLTCESDANCATVLGRRYDGIEVVPDVASLSPPPADFVVGGWPCQDLTSAGLMVGIRGERSGLFFEMVRVAKAAGAHTVIGENVPNLLILGGGRDFQVVIDTLREAGFPFVAWRTLNAREFGLPQERRRVFVVASTHREVALALHSEVPKSEEGNNPSSASGFYWTGGGRSLCYSEGYTPALKIGASDGGGRSPIAVWYGETVRKLSPAECVSLQGFDPGLFSGLRPGEILRMAGNAVPKPVGEFVLGSVFSARPFVGTRAGFAQLTPNGFVDERVTWVIEHQRGTLAQNLGDFLDFASNDSLSAQAAAGLLVRTIRSGYVIPVQLFDVLWTLSRERGGPIKPSRGDSFKVLDQEIDAAGYRGALIRSAQRYRIDAW